MKTKYIYHLILVVLVSACSEEHTPQERLPPATQTGANTFGCLLNGKVWLPKGNNGTSNLSLSYDPTLNQGTFDLRTYRYPDKTDWNQYIAIFSDSLASKGDYLLEANTHQAIYYSDKNGCSYSTDDVSVKCSGKLNVSKFDLKSGIISGTFDFIISQPGCDTIKVTQGRFDIKL